MPAHGGTSAVKRPCSSIGHTSGCRRRCRRSGRPRRSPGAMCTTPVPSSVDDEVAGEHLERVRRVGEEREQRRVAAADEVAALDACRRATAFGQLPLVGREARLGEDVAHAVLLDHRVVDVGPDGEGEVGRQRPRRRRPGQDALARVELEPHGERRVLAVAVDVVHPRLGVAERRLAPPAVGQHPEALVDQALVPQRLERPHDALHVGEVEGLVVVVEVDPAGLAGDVALPLVGVAQHAGAAGVVELVDAELGDRRMPGDAELLLGLDLGRQAVAVPAEAALDAAGRASSGSGARRPSRSR